MVSVASFGLLGCVEVPVGFEVVALKEGTDLHDGLGPGDAPACSGDVEVVVDEGAAGPLDDAGGDRGAGLEVESVVHEASALQEEAGRLVDRLAIGRGETPLGGAAMHAGGDLARVSFEETLETFEHPLLDCQ
jgi:hypothetical protein